MARRVALRSRRYREHAGRKRGRATIWAPNLWPTAAYFSRHASTCQNVGPGLGSRGIIDRANGRAVRNEQAEETHGSGDGGEGGDRAGGHGRRDMAGAACRGTARRRACDAARLHAVPHLVRGDQVLRRGFRRRPRLDVLPLPHGRRPRGARRHRLPLPEGRLAAAAPPPTRRHRLRHRRRDRRPARAEPRRFRPRRARRGVRAGHGGGEGSAHAGVDGIVLPLWYARRMHLFCLLNRGGDHALVAGWGHSARCRERCGRRRGGHRERADRAARA